MPVYFIGICGRGVVKIGYSSNITKRMSAIQGHNSGKLILLRTIHGSRKTEAWLHKKYSEYRINREWFKYREDMMSVTPPNDLEEKKEDPVQNTLTFQDFDGTLTGKLKSYRDEKQKKDPAHTVTMFEVIRELLYAGLAATTTPRLSDKQRTGSLRK